MPVLLAEYPKTVDGVIYNSEQEHIDIQDSAEKQHMLDELKKAGHEVDGRRFKGASGMGSLMAYFEAKMSQQGDTSDDDSGEDS